MFRLSKHKTKHGEKFDFHFSNLQALQVPKGWDKLFVSIISVETGKALVKSGKAIVKNGSCRWTETLSESIWMPQHDAPKENEEHLQKLVVAMGSAKSGALGEAIVNLASYKASKTALPVSLPLKKCSHGTILKLKIQCLSPTDDCPTTEAELREEQSEDKASSIEDLNIGYSETENKSEDSNSSSKRSFGSSSSNPLHSTSFTGDLQRDLYVSASPFSFDSTDGSLSRETCSPRNDFNIIAKTHIARQDSTGSNSQDSTVAGSYSFNGSSRSNLSSFNSKFSIAPSNLRNQKDDINWVSRTVASSPLQNSNSYKDLEAAEVTIEELRAEVSMWEQNAQKLMIDLERLKKDLSDQSERQTSLEMKLSESCLECDHLKLENKRLNVLLEGVAGKRSATDDKKVQEKEMDNLLKEMESELKFQKECNANLDLQLQRTQESNIELVSILQELEDTIEKQKKEIADLLNTHSKYEDAGNKGHQIENNEETLLNKEVFGDNLTSATFDPNIENTPVEHLEKESSLCFEPEETQLQELQNDPEYRMKFLEKSLQDKIFELEFDRNLKAQTLMKLESEWKNKLIAKEEEIINLEAKLSAGLNASVESGACNPIKDIEVLKQKIEELERECNELTEENLQLLVKLKESTLNLPSRNSSESSINGILRIGSLSTAESEVSKLTSQICMLEDDLNQKKILIEDLSADHLQVKCIDLEKRCTDLELQLQASKEEASYLDSELCQYRILTKQLEMEITLKQVERFQVKETKTDNDHEGTCSKPNISESNAFVGMTELLSNIDEQIQLCIACVKMQQYSGCLPTDAENKYRFSKSQIALLGQREQGEAILDSVLQLKDLLEVKNTASADELDQSADIREVVSKAETNLRKHEDYDLKEKPLSTSYPELENQQTESKPEASCFGHEPVEIIYETDKLRSDILLKEEEEDCHRKLKSHVSSLQNEMKLEEKMEAMAIESKMAFKCFDDFHSEMMVLNSSLDSHVSSKNNLIMKSSELEISEKEVENHLSELEKENVQLAERICGLESQLRYLTDVKESSRLDLENSESCVASFKEDVMRLEGELEAQKADMKYKLQEIQMRWLEAQEECEYLKIANVKLQSTAASLIEECSLLQKSNIEFKNQNVELYERCTVLEAELKESEKVFSNMVKGVEALEEKYTTMLEEIASKEKALDIELDTLLDENRRYKEKMVTEENLLNQMYLEKMVEVEKLQRQIADLTEQISAGHDEERRTTSDAVLEMSSLCAEKALLEASLNEVRGKLKVSEINFSTIQIESEAKLKALGDELAVSKQNQEVLMADHEKLLELLEDVKSSEEKYKGIVRVLRLKLKTSEYQRLKLTDEISNLKLQLEKTVVLQDEILALKGSLSEAKFENKKLEGSLQSLSGDYEAQKTQKFQLELKLIDMQKALSELEDCKRSKVVLEEKVLRLEGDLTAREALGAADAELKNELARVKRANNELQRRIRHLEEEKQESRKRAQAFAEEPTDRKEVKQDQNRTTVSSFSICFETNSTSTPTSGDSNQVDSRSNHCTGSLLASGTEPLSKIQQLEIELAEALEANDLYKTQLKSLLSEGGSQSTDLKVLSTEDGFQRNGYHGDISSLQLELKDIRERYFHMSLKYAEVEAEREQLVLKLKSTSNGRRWFR
ncbi:hypothetical protein K2173_020417 [Erythroxylum novogranatense]|uniref:C2 NT-type domain-containing protein n=1 Tax=Erythroxylum novogranatense TaxID=1862640 RepID=A0AAV8THP5_9ROSI|nr:hypothetical protein K2173_020417 [Erythroxylum novogranatense]